MTLSPFGGGTANRRGQNFRRTNTGATPIPKSRSTGKLQ
jgi:hypothetical protein